MFDDMSKEQLLEVCNRLFTILDTAIDALEYEGVRQKYWGAGMDEDAMKDVYTLLGREMD
jgi:hypothetical protein